MAKSNQNPVVVVPDYSMAFREDIYYRDVRILIDEDDYRPYFVYALGLKGLTCRFRRMCDAKTAISKALNGGVALWKS